MKLNNIKFTKAGKAYFVWALIEVALLVVIAITVGFWPAVIVWTAVGAIECAIVAMKYGWSSLLSGDWMIERPSMFKLVEEEIKW